MTFVATYVALVTLAVAVVFGLGIFAYWCYHLWSERSDPSTSWKAGLTLLVILAILKGVMKH